MAEPNNLFSLDEQNSLRDAVTGSNTFTLGGLGINAPSAITQGISAVIDNPVVSQVGAFGNLAMGTRDEMLASEVVNPQQNMFQSIAKSGLPSFISGRSSLDTMRDRADINKDGRVDNTEYDAYSFNFGKNLGVAPVSRTNLAPAFTPTNVTMFDNPFEKIKTIDLTTKPKQNFSSGMSTPMGVGATGDLGGATGSGLAGTGGFLGFGRSEGVGESGPTGLGGSEQTGEQTSIQNTQDLSKSFADDAASSSDDSTFICTALYEMGDMKKYIYKYDHLYGRKVHPAIYRGYALWGEPLARQIKKKRLVYKIIKPIALTWAKQMAYDLSKGRHGKNNKAMKITKTIGEGICYALGQIFKRRQIWQKSI